MKRVFFIMADSFGCGAAPDAADFGDAGIDGCAAADTLASVASSPRFDARTLASLGLFEVGRLSGKKYPVMKLRPGAAYARLRERSAGKDTVIGHWELCGVVSPKPMRTWENGFSAEEMETFSKAAGRPLLCGKPYSGTEVIRDYGREHVETGALIIYTSADSVVQIAAHESVVPVEELYRICEAVRAVTDAGRVIARPFEGEWPYTRTARRHDFALPPPAPTLLDKLSDAGRDVIAIGKIRDIFAGRGITSSVSTVSNDDGMRRIDEAAASDFDGLCFANLVDFDMLYGHRNDIDGYARAISEFDRWLCGFIGRMRPTDALVVTADHGCDPGYPTTDHTREYVPYLALGTGVSGDLGGKDFGFVAETILRLFNTEG